MNTGNRRRGRESTLQILYQLEAEENATHEMMATLPRGDEIKTHQLLPTVDKELARKATLRYFDNFSHPEKVQNTIRTMVFGIMDHIDAIDGLIVEHSTKWRLDRMSLVDRNVVRIGLYELLHHPDLDSAVIINEAVEIAKRYGTEESAAFVNGLLDKIASICRADANGNVDTDSSSAPDATDADADNPPKTNSNA
jgi:transcription antitermination protein NusB